MSENELHIDEHNHERVPTLSERFTYALLSAFLGFALINIIAFWMFPGAGIGAIYLLPGLHKSITIASGLTTVILYTVPILCFVFGWFQGQHFIGKLKYYLDYWKFW